ncbi:hypothetical protein BDY19DRAFT_940617, partial [Irpex rosettiformis]
MGPSLSAVFSSLLDSAWHALARTGSSGERFSICRISSILVARSRDCFLFSSAVLAYSRISLRPTTTTFKGGNASETPLSGSKIADMISSEVRAAVREKIFRNLGIVRKCIDEWDSDGGLKERELERLFRTGTRGVHHASSGSAKLPLPLHPAREGVLRVVGKPASSYTMSPHCYQEFEC